MKTKAALQYIVLATLLTSCSNTSSLVLPRDSSGGIAQAKQRYSRPIVFQGGEPTPFAQQVVAFAKENKGKAVGDGECWGLVNLAYRSAGVRHRGGRVWGRQVNWQREGVRPGDIIEFENARYPHAYTDAHHTAIILKVADKDSVLVAHQYWNGIKKVSTTYIPLTYLRAGRQTIYRYEH